ncbi:MFS transporter [Streptomyces litchfieldiae]|uniref:MFS transporter n=1 Tax=Streptomyces litchfieldiae TaxID=3075543 RepID=A0ABU2MN27_9ACTN|nr:MFS transporter [Streptomyces sp. DSM 44938]MDT0343016.1 MFS transporter [Streptomyces sp. DSM 44938]
MSHSRTAPPAVAGRSSLLTVSGGTLIAAGLGGPPPRRGRGRRAPRWLAPYARLFAEPGALAFTVPNLIARLPSGMFSVAAVIMITAHHDSYALAGAVVATGLAVSTVTAPLIARLVDRHGQARIAVPAVATSCAGHAALLACVVSGAPVWSYFCCELLTAAMPNTGGMSRARWAHIHRGSFPERVAARHTANSFEQAMDELCFMCGPVLAAFLCTALFPEAGTVTATVLLFGGTVAFAAQRRTEPPVARRAAGGPAPVRAPGMAALLATFVCTGALFGSMEVVTIAFADERGQQGWAGVVLAAQAAGSATAGLLFGLLRPGGSVRSRFVVCVAAMAVLMSLLAPAARAESLLLLAPVLLVAGMATAPTMVTGMTLVQDVTPAGRLNEGMTLAVAALLGGIALGSAGGGMVVEAHGAVAGYWFPMGAALVAAAVAAAAHGPRPGQRARRKSAASGPASEPPEPPSSNMTAKARSRSPR